MLCLIFNSCSTDYTEENQNLIAKGSSNDTIGITDSIKKDLDADIRIDENVNEENAIIIESEEEYRAFVQNARKNLLPESPIPQIEISCADGVCVGSVDYGGFGSLNFDVSISDGCIDGISGGLTGFHFGLSYSQGGTTFGCNLGTVCGYLHYNLFFEGIGSVYSQRMFHSISINC